MSTPQSSDFTGASWRTSTRSSTGQCVQVATVEHHGAVFRGVRDSKATTGPTAGVLVFTAAAWTDLHTLLGGPRG